MFLTLATLLAVHGVLAGPAEKSRKGRDNPWTTTNRQKRFKGGATCCADDISKDRSLC